MGKCVLVALLASGVLGCARGAGGTPGRNAGLADADPLLDTATSGGHDSRGDDGEDESSGSSDDGGKTPSENSTTGDGEDGSTSGGDGSSSDGGETGVSVGPGDPGCPPGFLQAIDITDDTSDDMSNHCGWVTDAWLGRGRRVSLEVWSADGDHYGPIVWDVAGLATPLAQFAACSGPVTGAVSEDGQWRLSLIPGDTYVFVTAADDDPQIGDTHLYMWLAPRYTGNDELFGIDEPYPGAWSTREESGDRIRGCYEP